MTSDTQTTIAAAGLRVMAGAFFIPHILGKALPPHGPVNFFAAAGYPVPWFTMTFVGVIEVAVAICLIFGVYVRYAALVGAGVLGIAAASIIKVGGDGVWLWNFGGVEYLIFWALLCVFVAILHSDEGKNVSTA